MEFKEIVKNVMQSGELKSKLVSLKSFNEVYNFFKENGYEGSEEKLKENLFSENSVTNEISEEELEQIAGGVSGKKAMAACASLMMLMGAAPTGTNNATFARAPFISNIIEKIKEKRHEAKRIKPTKEKTAAGNPSEEKVKEKKVENYDAEKAEKAEKELERFFEEDFKGQEKAKEQIRTSFTQYNAERKVGINNLTESQLPSPKILIFDGPDEAGKRYVAEQLSKIFSDVAPYITTATDIKECVKNQYMGYAEAFMHGKSVSSDESLFRHLKKNEGKVKFVIIDNYHELFEKQEDGRYPEQHPLDEMFRGIIDNNLKDWYGNEVDLSGTISICTTNETKASVQGRVRVSDHGKLVEIKTDEEGRPIIDENGDYVYKAPTTDNSKETVVPHDASLMNRLFNICYFD